MADKDTVTKEFMSDAAHFADAFNYLLYDGKEVIKPEQLQPLDPTEIVMPYGADGKTEFVQKYRDVLKRLNVMSDGKKAYLILGIENQSAIHYAMPVRTMLYDAMQYSSQVNETAKLHRKESGKSVTKAEFLSGWYKDDRLIPTVTIVIFFGDEKWDAPMSLHEMMGIEDDVIRQFIPDYRINLIAPEAISEQDFAKFHSDLRQVLKFVKYSGDGKKLDAFVMSDNAFGDIDRKTADTIMTITNTTLHFPDGEERVNMCKAIQDIRVEGDVKAIMNIMETLGLTFEQAFAALKLPTDQYDAYREMVEAAQG